jgi:signal transduction histidine kinase
MTRVLLIDDDREEYELVGSLLSGLEGADYALDWVGTDVEALAAIDRAEHDVYLVDYRLNCPLSGLDVLREAKRRGSQAPMIILTGDSDAAVDREAMRGGAADYLIKGQFSADVLARSLRYAVERGRLQGMYVQAEKLSAMGLLAAGVAHELNNPLSVILCYCDPALAAGGPEEAAANLKKIGTAAHRCRDLVKELLEFSRKDQPAAADFALDECVRVALALTEPQARWRSVSIVRELGAGRAVVRGHKNHLEQVLVNLVVNALDAMPRGGRLTVRTGPAEGAARPSVRVDVIDTGEGLTPEAREKLFEPFFTTKAPGKGTGLGLSLSQKLVAAHGGTLQAESAPGRGSTFSIVLPVDGAPE